MAWADDTRCLFCDGKLPLYRKLTQGQFCSKPHQDAYWKEQNQLAVEVLHRTHDALKSYKPAVPIEDILGPTPSAPVRAPQTAAEPWWATPQAEPEPEPEAELEPEPTFSYAIHEVKPYIVERSAQAEAPAPPPIPDCEPEGDFSFSYALPQVVEKRERLPELAHVPALAGLIPQVEQVDLAPPPALAIMATDPVEYDMWVAFAHPRHPLVLEPVDLAPVHVDPVSLAGQVPLPALFAAVCETECLAADLGPCDTPVSIERPGLVSTLATRLPAAAAVALEAGRLAHSPWPSAPLEPVEFSAAPLHIAENLDRELVPCGDPIEQLEREAFPFNDTVLDLAAPKPVALAVAAAAGGTGCYEFAAPTLHQPAYAWTVRAPQGLPEVSELLALPTEFPPHLSAAAEMAGPQQLDPRASAVNIPATNLAIEHDPALAGLASLPRVLPRTQTAGAYRPVCYQAFTPSGQVQRPNAAMAAVTHVFSPRLHTNVFRLEMIGKLRPRDCSLPQRGLMPPVFEPGEARLPSPVLEVRAWRTPLGQAAAMASLLPDMATRLPRSLVNGASHFWSHAPRDLKILLFAVPVALGLAFAPDLPKVSTRAPEAPSAEFTGFHQNLTARWDNLRKAMAERAAVGLDENFRHALDNWQAIDGSTAEWSFDQAGFVLPGRVALYKPSLGLNDYELQFLGAVDAKALSWVVRASDFQNYYVVKLVHLTTGPIPRLGIIRYAVIDGKAVDRKNTDVALDARRDSLYRISMTLDGDRYSLAIQGRMIDSWEEPRLKHGGVGFFTARGEQSRIGWVQITHQYDMLGRLFAYLAP